MKPKSVPVVTLFLHCLQQKQRHMLEGETAAQTSNTITVHPKSKDVILCLCLIKNIELYGLLKSLVSFFFFAYLHIINYLGVFSHTEIMSFCSARKISSSFLLM